MLAKLKALSNYVVGLIVLLAVFSVGTILLSVIFSIIVILLIGTFIKEVFDDLESPYS